ncbi:hypothetical protein [Leucobacter komagatae]|uniref:hypothetical protein n=1 Tax=Leucobacter komagatae TaxID=55969 RepID=UPI0012ECDDAB|nr:hypothetical protein [Leucobacter komagatae]
MSARRPTRGKMRPGSVLSEALRNTITGTSKALTLVIAAGAIVSALLWMELNTITRITDAAQKYQDSGAAVQVLYAPGGVNPQACEALNKVSGINAAGAIRDTDTQIRPAAAPQSVIPAKDATPGIMRILEIKGTSSREGILASRQVAEAFSVSAGGTLVTTAGSEAIQGIYDYPDDGRMPGYGYAALNPVSLEGRFDACWAEVWPENPETAALLWTALDSQANTKDTPPTIGQLNTTLGDSFAGEVEFSERNTQYNALVSACGLFVLGYMATRVRRLELSSALHTGVNKTGQIYGVLIETSVWVLVAASISIAVALVSIQAGLPQDQPALAATAARFIAVSISAAPVGAALAAVLTKEKHLFRYFKER